jgi:hypothetical protein
MTTKGASIGKISRLLDVLEKHIKEENCKHTPKELAKRTRKSMTV